MTQPTSCDGSGDPSRLRLNNLRRKYMAKKAAQKKVVKKAAKKKVVKKAAKKR